MKKLLMITIGLLVAGGLVFSASIDLKKPNGGEILNSGSSFVIQWTADGTTNPFKITIWEVGGTSAIGVVKIKSAGNGTRNFNWTVGKLDNGYEVPYGKKYLIKVKEQNPKWNIFIGLSSQADISPPPDCRLHH